MHRIELAPNCSLSLPEAAVFFVAVAAAPLFVALVLLAQGFWPVLPVAGLELLLLGWALWANLRRGARREYVLLDERTVAVEKRGLRRHERVAEFPREWARVALHRGCNRHAPSRLMLQAQGRRCEIGGFLREEERVSLARRLTQLLGRVPDAPRRESHKPQL